MPSQTGFLGLSDEQRARIAALVPAPSCYLRVDDNIRVTSYNALASVILSVRYRLLDLDGNIVAGVEAQTPNTDRSAKSAIFPTPEGWLLGLEIFASSAAPLVSQTYVVVEVVRGLASSAIALQSLGSGTLTAKQPFSWPFGPFAGSLEGGGALRSISGTTPAAGAEISETVPTGARWELLSFSTLLTTAIAAANRLPMLLLDDGVNVYFRDPLVTAETASLATTNVWAAGIAPRAGLNSNVQEGMLPVGLKLGSGHRLRTSTSGIQGADQYSAVQYLVREWIEGA